MIFADTASRLAGLAARTLGWRPHEFWTATPAELALSLSLGGDDAASPPPSRQHMLEMIEKEHTDARSR